MFVKNIFKNLFIAVSQNDTACDNHIGKEEGVISNGKEFVKSDTCETSAAKSNFGHLLKKPKKSFKEKVNLVISRFLPSKI